MVITTTSIGFLSIAIGIAFLGFQFLKVFRKNANSPTDTRIRFLIGFCFLTSALENVILGLGSLFFLEYPFLFGVTFLVSHLFLIAFAALAVYLFYYIFFPTTAYLPAVIVTLTLGVLGLVVGVMDLPKPFLVSSSNIDWTTNPLFSFITFVLLMIGISFSTYIFIRMLKTKNANLKKFAVIVTVFNVIALINLVVKFLPLFGLRDNWHDEFFDIGAITVGLGIFTLIILHKKLTKLPKDF